MSIALSEEQVALAESVAKFAARHAPTSTTRLEFEDLAAGIWPTWWDALRAQGLLSLHLPASAGGDDAGLAELAVVVEETGRALLPGPYLPTVLASAVVTRLGHAHGELLERFAQGTTGTCATTAEGLTAHRTPAGWTVTGTTAPLIGALSAEVAVLGARTADNETVWFTTEPRERQKLTGIDLTRDIGTLRLDALAITGNQVLNGGEDAVRDIAALLFSAEAAGLARWCQETGVAYAKVREQFGRTIGSFQAIKHKCARMWTQLELMTASVWDAAMAADQAGRASEHGDQFALAAAAASVATLPGAADLALETVTLLGGIGYTWEHDAHLYWRRAMSLASLLGPAHRWQRRLASRARTTARAREIRLGEEPPGLREEVAALLEAAKTKDEKERRAFLAGHRLVAPHYPPPYGRGADATAQVVIAQEFARVGLEPVSLVIGDWALPTILAHGTQDQRERFVTPTLRGELTWCQLFSEPGAGSDLASLSTRAERAEKGWRLSGQKVWTSSAREADWGICLARTDPDKPKHKGLGYFLVDMRSPGLQVRPLREANGGYLFNEVFFTDVFVPEDLMVGAPGDGWRLARTTLGNERVSMGTGLSSTSRKVPEWDDATEAQAGMLYAKLMAHDALGARALARRLSGLQPGAEASALKLSAGWNALDVTRAAWSWHGPQAATTEGTAGENPAGAAAHAFLSCPPVLIGGGTAEIQLNVIGERVLGLPRD